MKEFLERLRGKIFKLLPMREDSDNGEQNYLKRYLVNLTSSYDGMLLNYPKLKEISSIIEVQNNLASMRENPCLEFDSWRATVLRSVRLIDEVIQKENWGMFV